MSGGELVLKLLELFRAPAHHPLVAEIAALAEDPADPLFEPTAVAAVVAATLAALAREPVVLPPLVEDDLLAGLGPDEAAEPLRQEMCTRPAETHVFGPRPRDSTMLRFMGVVARVGDAERMYMCGAGTACAAADVAALSLLRSPARRLCALADEVCEFAAPERRTRVPAAWIAVPFLLEVRRARQRLRAHQKNKRSSK